MKSTPDAFPIAIIGAGFAGIGTAVRLQQEGIRGFTIFEQANEIGGTWRDNTYPGCACDVPSHLYSFSFDANPDWSEQFSRQPEILDYLKGVVDRHNLRPAIRFGVRVEGAEFDEDEGLWHVHLSTGEVFRARVVVSGSGPLNVPSIPDIPGRDSFQGEQFHSSTWNHSYDLRGKRVASIGTGASAIQYVPEIAPEVDQLHVFQRTAPWVLPKMNQTFSKRRRRAFAAVPALRKAYRNLIYWIMESRGIGFVKAPRLLQFISRLATRHIEKSVSDPALRAKVTPEYTLGCKRILGSDRWYPTLERDNVDLVTDEITEIRSDSVVTADGVVRPVDAIIWGTGFRVTEFIARMNVRGIGGLDINDAWKHGAEAYYGMTVAGFPNFFILVGPNTGLGHNSIVFMIEAQVHYILQCIKRLRERDLAYLDVRPAVQRSFNENLQSRMLETVWLTGCQSWYLDEQGKNFSLWPGFTFEYWLRTRRVDWSAFREAPRVARSVPDDVLSKGSTEPDAQPTV
ncbi:MAG: NAD(P)/FAD-dependent oxidoreductase [Myxococcota bacterium]